MPVKSSYTIEHGSYCFGIRHNQDTFRSFDEMLELPFVIPRKDNVVILRDTSSIFLINRMSYLCMKVGGCYFCFLPDREKGVSVGWIP